MKALVVLLSGDKKNAADRFHRAALAADDPAHIAVGNTDLNTNVLSVRDLVHLCRLGGSSISRSFIGRCLLGCFGSETIGLDLPGGGTFCLSGRLFLGTRGKGCGSLLFGLHRVVLDQALNGL